MTFLQLVRKNLFRKKLRVSLTVFAILIAFLIFGVLGAAQALFNQPPSAASASRLIATNKINFTVPLPISYAEKVRAIEGVTRVSHQSWFGGYYQVEANRLIAFAVEPQTFLDTYTEFAISAEAREVFLRERTAIMVGADLAKQYNWKPGDRIPMRSDLWRNSDGGDTWEFLIAGTFTQTDPASEGGFVFFRYDYFNESRSFGRDAIGNLIVTVADPSMLDAVSERIDASFANSQFETDTKTEAAFNQSFLAQFGNIAFIINAVVGAAFVTILMIVGNSMMLTIRERTAEIGVMKTIGFTSQRIFAMVLGESMLLALAGGLLGLGLAWAMVTVLSGYSGGFGGALALTPGVALTGFGLMALLGFVTGFLPAWRAMRIDVVTALSRK